MKAEFYESVGASGLPQAALEVGRPALGKGRVEKDGTRVRAFVDPGEPRPWQRLGRLLGEEGIFSFALDAPKGMAFGKDQALCLLQGMRVAKAPKETCRIALPLGEGELSGVAQEWAILDWARDLANRGASACRPQDLARAVASALGAISEGYGLAARSEIIMGDDLRLKGLTGLCAVGGGSAHGPCMLVMEVAAGQDLLGTPPEVALVGKGITFDSGGYDLKTAAFMDTMRTDKCGAVYLAAVAMLLASRQGCPHLLLCLPCAENLAGPMAMLPGDILNYPNGLAVEVGNTDAEGRLVLADALILASGRKPGLIICAATLTGAAKRAVGRDMTAVLSPLDSLPPGLCESFAHYGDPLWRLPMVEAIQGRFLKSRRADLTNSANDKEAPGASVAALFLSRFVGQGIPFVHLDLSSAYLPHGNDWYAEGPTAAAVLPLARFLGNGLPQGW